jgi:hypothetical protein
MKKINEPIIKLKLNLLKKRLKKNNKYSLEIVDENLSIYEKCISISFITEQLELKRKQHREIQAEMPRNLDIVPQTV